MTSKQIRELRTRLGLTQAEFARRVGTTVTTVSRWETGRRRPMPVFARLLAGIELPADS